MKCILMNKNTEILLCEYNDESKYFDSIYDVYNINYAPYIVNNFFNKEDINNSEFKSNLSEWFRGRGIPDFRDKLDLLLHRLNINYANELLDKSFGLSLTDQYWIKPVDLDINYDNVNFFDNDFDYSEFMEASLSKNDITVRSNNSLKTPNNTTDGMLKKAWIIKDNIRFLIKGGYKNETLQPFNEVLASEICKRLGFDYVKYNIDLYKDMVVSSCPCFINKDTEFIPASQILNSIKGLDNFNYYEEYIKMLEDNGIKDARIKLENMFILDYLIMNEDRHLNNFGIIRNVNTLEWIDVAPIFDNGQSLNIEYYDSLELHISGERRFFYEVLPFEDIIKVVKDIKRIDINNLDGIVSWFDDLLHKYQNITGYSDSRINKICILLNRQIDLLRKMIEESTN